MSLILLQRTLQIFVGCFEYHHTSIFWKILTGQQPQCQLLFLNFLPVDFHTVAAVLWYFFHSQETRTEPSDVSSLLDTAVNGQ